MIHKIENLHRSDSLADYGRLGWLPGRPVGVPFSYRAYAAWLVLTGKADAVVWPER